MTRSPGDDAARLVNTDQEELLQRGARELLKLQKRLARLDLLELQAAMDAALQGDPEDLANWLENHDQGIDNPPSADGSSRASLVRETEHLGNTASAAAMEQVGSSDALPFSSWQEIVPHCIARLETDSGTAVHVSDEQPADGKERDLATSAIEAPLRGESRESSGDNAALEKSEPSSDAEPVPVAVEPAEVATKHRRILTRARWRGAISSAIAHLALLFLLAFVTLKTAPPPAGMSFESASPVRDDVEVLELPEQMEELSPSEELIEPSQSSPTELADMSAQLDPLPSASELSTSLPASTSSLSPQQAMAVSGINASSASSVRFFGAAAGGNSFCYVIDGSGSMRDGPWEAAKAELVRSLGTLKPTQRFYIIFFNRELQAIAEPGQREPAKGLLYATRENVEHATRWLNTLKIGPGAPPTKALELAVSLEPDAIYLLTDGVTRVDVAGFLRQINRDSDLIYGEMVRVPIHTIAFYSPEGQDLLRRITSENGGQFVYVPDPRKPK